jgi:hypothetical protein
MINNCPQFSYYNLVVLLKHVAVVIRHCNMLTQFNMFSGHGNSLTCGYSFLGSTLLSMANTNAAVFPVPD